MNAIADAVVYAVTYINCRHGDDDAMTDDVGALEGIAAILQNATQEEQDALASAAERALAQEKTMAIPRKEFLHDYAQWMEDLFVEGWTGNQRVKAR